MVTWHHLPSSRYFTKQTFIPSGPFYGENILAAFMLMILPIMLFLPKLKHNLVVKLFSGLGVLLILLVITIQGARIALLAAAALIGFVWLRLTSLRTKLISVIILIMFAWGIWHFAGSFIRLTWGIFGREVTSISSESSAIRMSSVKIRKQLVTETLDILSGSGFVGVGAGNVEHYMDTDRVYRTAGIINPHNYFLELMSNFGLGFLLVFLGMYTMWLYRMYMAMKHGVPEQKAYHLMYLLVLLMFIPAAALPSSIKWNHLIWIVFAQINQISHPKSWQLRAS
jgi:teichuronic acid biosynthesis protein TuaE